MKIFVLGWYNHHNVGDESYKTTFPKLFKSHTLTFSDKISDLKDESLIILGGGNILKKYFIDELKKVNNKRIIGFSIGMEENIEIPDNLFEHIYARDFKTIELLKSKNIPCSYVPDAAFCLEPKETNYINNHLKSENLDVCSKKITVVLNSYILYNNSNSLSRDFINFHKFSNDFTKIIDENNHNFIFLPFGTSMPVDDRTINSWVASKCKYHKKNLIIFDRINYQECLNIIYSSDLVISTRLHSSIFSFISGTPFIDITHHSKNEEFLKTIKKEENSISFWDFNSYKMKSLINNLIGKKHKEYLYYQEKLQEVANAIYFGE